MEISDEEYYKWLQAQETEAWYANLLNKALHTSSEAWTEAIAEGVKISEADFKKSTEASMSVEGGFINILRTQALRIIGKQADLFNKTRVFMFPTSGLNGFASLTPRGTPFIVLNQGIINILGFYTMWYTSFYTWHTDEPYCQDHSQDEFAEAIISLARFASTGDPKYMAGVKPMKCPSIPRWQDSTYTDAHFIELVIILHEFGHLIRGHLDTSSTFCVRLTDGTNIEGLKLSREQEFEADEFAYESFCHAIKDGPMLTRDVAHLMGLLFKFFELCHRLYPPTEPEEKWTHPHPEERWKRIRRLAKIEDYPNTFAFNLDSMFDVIFKGAGLKK